MRLSRSAIAGLGLLIALPFLIRFFFGASEKYYLHLLIQIFIWSFIYTGWSLMGRFGLTSLGHGAFTGIGAYVLRAAVELCRADAMARHSDCGRGRRRWSALLVGYPCFHLRITGHYFALLTLALTEFVRLCIVGLRDYTGGSLGTQPRALWRRALALRACNSSRAACSPITSRWRCGSPASHLEVRRPQHGPLRARGGQSG